MQKKILNEIKQITQLNHLEKEGLLTGTYRGYNLSIGTLSKSQNISYIHIPLKIPQEFSAEKVSIFLNELRGKYKGISVASYEGFRIKINYAPRLKKQNKTEIIMNIINEILNFSNTNSFVSCCEICGESNVMAPLIVNGVIKSCCINCRLDVKNSIAMNQQAQREKKSNIIGGIVGSLIGALIGAVVWIIIYQLGYIAAVGGLAIAVCSIKGYELFGGKLNLTGIIITSIITIASVYLAQHISLGIDIYNAYKELDITIFDAIRSVPEFLTEESIVRPFLTDLIVGYILTLIGSVSYIIRVYKQSNYKIDVQEINI